MDNLINDLLIKCCEYPHEIRAKHVAVLLKNNKPVSEYKFNHIRNNILGISCGTAHAEALAVQELCRKIINRSGLNKSALNYIGKWLIKKQHCIL